MKSFVRHAILLGMALILAGCVANVANPSPVNRVPVGITNRSNIVPADGAPQAPARAAATPVVAPRSIPVTGNTSPANTAPLNDSSAADRQPAQELRADRITSSGIGASSNSPTPVALVSKPKHPLDGAELYVHIPPQANPQQSLRVLLVLHGMGGSGEPFSQNLLRDAERNNWVIVAPTFQYHDYLDPKPLMEDDIQFAKRILDTLDVLPQRLNLKLRQHILIYGFSRGAQLAHRFAFFYPDRVESVVTISAGAYTLPEETQLGGKVAQVLPFPYGIGDLKECVGQPVNWQALKKISFWIGVGALDDQASEVSRAFDPYGGKTRVERAQTFQQALKVIGIDVHLTIFPDAAHEVTSQMRSSAVQFLSDDELADHWDD